MEKTGCKIICGAPTTLAVKGLMMMMTVVSLHADRQYCCCFVAVRWYRCTLTYSIIAVLLLCGGIAARKSKGLFLGKVCLMFVHVLFVSYLRRD